MPAVSTASVLVHAAADRIPETAQAIADLDGVAEVYSCAGDVDLIAVVKVREHDELADVIAGRLSKIDGVRRTDTHTGRVLHVIRTGIKPHGLAYFPQPGRYSMGHNGVYR